MRVILHLIVGTVLRVLTPCWPMLQDQHWHLHPPHLPNNHGRSSDTSPPNHSYRAGDSERVWTGYFPRTRLHPRLAALSLAIHGTFPGQPPRTAPPGYWTAGSDRLADPKGTALFTRKIPLGVLLSTGQQGSADSADLCPGTPEDHLRSCLTQPYPPSGRIPVPRHAACVFPDGFTRSSLSPQPIWYNGC